MICQVCPNALIQKVESLTEIRDVNRYSVTVICILTHQKVPAGLVECSQAPKNELVDLGYGAMPEVKKKGWPLGKKRKP